jgi:hypothetical protein
MPPILMRVALLALPIAGAWAQGAEDAPQKFPSDNQDPGRAGAFQMLNAVCPGRAVVLVRPDLPPIFGCPTCPGSDIGPLMVKNVVRGHFLSPTSDDAALSTENCLFQDGRITYLVSRRGGKWILIGDEFQDASLCHKVRLDDGRDVLVCLEVEYRRMEIVYQVTYHDYKRLDYHALYELSDYSQNCGVDPNDVSISERPVTVERTYVSGVDFRTNQGRPVGLDAIVNRGNKVFEKPIDCSLEQIPTHPTLVHFTWTGKGYEQAK